MTAATIRAQHGLAGVDLSTLPVFGQTIAELGRLAPRGERVALPELTDIVLHDPLLVLRLLQTVNGRRSRLGAEITTVGHAVMMLGVQPFFQRFSGLTSVEERLASRPAALADVQRRASRAHHAAYQARDWAIQRADIESEEVFVATTLAELPEMVRACLLPDGGQADAEAGNTLREALFDACRIPERLRMLSDPGRGTQPRAVNVQLALALARHAASGWWGRDVAQDLEAAAAFLHLPLDEAIGRIHRTAVLAARAWRWYGAPPAAALLPLLPLPEAPEPAPRPQAAAPRTSQALLGWALDTLRREVGLGRVMFALASADRQWLRVKCLQGVAADSPLAGFALGLARPNLFGQLLGRPQSVWLHDANRANLGPLITADMTRLLGRDDFFAMSIFLGDKPLGLLYADARGGARKALDETSYHAFKQIGARIGQGLAQLARTKPA